MATERKHWFRVADSIQREPWGNDETALFVRLLAHLNSRRSRDGLTAEEASSATIRPGDLCSLAGCLSLVRARRILSVLAGHVSLTWSARGVNTLVVWPKLPDFQGWASESRAGNGQPPGAKVPLPTPTPTPGPTPEEKRREERPSDERGRSPLLNLLKNLPGDEAEKRAFLADVGPQIEVDAAESGKPVASTTVRYYRAYLKRGRIYQHAAAEAEKQAKRDAWVRSQGADYEQRLAAADAELRSVSRPAGVA